MRNHALIPATALLLATACAQAPSVEPPSDQNGNADPLMEEALAEMNANLEFNAVVHLLKVQGEVPVIDEASVEIQDGDEDTTSDFVVTVPVIDMQSGYPGEHIAISFESKIDGTTVVSLLPTPIARPLLCYPYPECVDEYPGPGSLPSCGYFNSSDTCRPAASTWTGSYCDGGAKLMKANRSERRYYNTGRKVTNLDTVYSCTALAAQSNCTSTCN